MVWRLVFPADGGLKKLVLFILFLIWRSAKETATLCKCSTWFCPALIYTQSSSLKSTHIHHWKFYTHKMSESQKNLHNITAWNNIATGMSYVFIQRYSFVNDQYDSACINFYSEFKSQTLTYHFVWKCLICFLNILLTQIGCHMC